MIKFMDFLLFGKVDSLCDNSTIAEVKDKYGEPDIYTPQKKSRPTIMVYGAFEFYFNDSKLSSVSLGFIEEHYWNPDGALELLDLSSLQGFKREDIEASLKQNRIKWKVDNIMTDEAQINLVTEYNVHLALNLKEKDEPLVRMGKVYSSSILGNYYDKMK